MNTSTIPMWQSELSKAHNRGLLVLIEGSLISCGIMIAYWTDYGFFQIKNNEVQWRFPIAFQAAFAGLLLIGILILPESPRWLIKKGESEQAAKVLAQLDRTTVDDPEIMTVVRQLEESIGASEKLMGDVSQCSTACLSEQVLVPPSNFSADLESFFSFAFLHSSFFIQFSYKELLTNGPEQNFYRTTIGEFYLSFDCFS